MWLVVGLGNPGQAYSKTRHNIGFAVIDRIAEEYSFELKQKENYIIGKGSIEGNKVILLEPLTFMNRSGLAVRDMIKRNGIQPSELIVVHDDIDMETGKLKIRKDGSSGGHKGVESIIQEIGTREFIRLKIGIGRGEGVPVEDYVLGKFKKAELPMAKEAVSRAADAVASILKNGAEKAMNSFNAVKAFIATEFTEKDKVNQ